ncbi:hypothetical protein SARC_09188 [Sphaeroforma arctica JP610]|uniref:Uncharacterized protein n=1 Tax=Sphaeroforma arctica JP610 TaxID=667725 RepID=A0A0L0FNJ4_9EUKA|nr:hypothetical protein SARC_09188 [Sphaeroforma arctica JP610]KNC78377.1 hypothetical protein SARC_09188 [Sphaeroforma arctica JP610]|eukprot:XP_014152279.1 hypothetical protein SARC_09188 [Sphaeroforma arctica JP610]
MGESAKTQADRPINAHTHVDAKTDLSHTSVDTHEVSSIVAHTPKTVDTRVRSPPQTMGTPPPAITLPPAHLKISSSRSLPSNSVDNRSSVGTVKTLDSDWLTDKMETDHWQLPDDFVVYDNKVKPTRARTSGSKQSAQHSTECATHDSVDPRENEPYTHMHTSATACDSSDVHVHIPTCDIPMHTSESAEHAHGTLQQAVESQEWVMEHSDAQTGCVREQERDADGSINRMQRSSSASLGTVLCTASLTGNGKNAHSCAKNSTRGSGSGSSRGSAKNRTHHDSGGSSGKPHPPTPKPHPTLRSLHSKVQPQPQPTRTDTQTPPTHSDTHTHPGTKLQQVFGDVARPGGVPMTRSHSRDQRVARRKGTRSKCEERTHNIAVPSLANSLSNRSQGSVVPNQSTSSLRMVGAPSASETRDGVQGLDCLPHIQRAGSSPTGSQIERTEHPAQPWVCASLHSSHHSLPAGRSGQSVNQAQYLRQPHSPPSSQHAPSHSAPWHTQGRVGQGSGSGGKSRTKTNSPHRCGHAGANTQPAKRTTELSLEGLDNTRLSPPHAPGRPKAKSSTPSASFVEWSPILPKNSSKRVHASDGATKPINDMPIMSTVARPVVRSAVTQPEPQTLIKPGLPMKKPRFPITATPSGVVVETPTVRATAVVDMTPMLKSLNISRDKVAHTSRNSSRNTSAEPPPRT